MYANKPQAAFRVEIEPKVASLRSAYYRYSIFTQPEHKCIYDGVASDARDAVDTAFAHVTFLTQSLAVSA